jgi:hypothetical protein
MKVDPFPPSKKKGPKLEAVIRIVRGEHVTGTRRDERKCLVKSTAAFVLVKGASVNLTTSAI